MLTKSSGTCNSLARIPEPSCDTGIRAKLLPGSLEADDFVNIHSGNENLHAAGGGAAHGQFLAGVQGLRGGGSEGQVETDRDVGQRNWIVVEIGVFWSFAHRGIIHDMNQVAFFSPASMPRRLVGQRKFGAHVSIGLD